MTIQIFWYMEIGPRDNQEDCIMFDDEIIQDDHARGHALIGKSSFFAAVCDGLGGHDAGEVASRFFCDNLVMIDPFISEKEINGALKKIQSKSVDLIPSLSGTTLAGIRIGDENCLVFNAGDSRVYHVSGGLYQVSHDHSYVQELVDQNLITEEVAENHPYKNIVTFGMGPVFELKENGRKIFFSKIDIKPGDSILICSDGVSDSLGKDCMYDALKKGPEGGKDLALVLDESGIRDNASFIHIWFP